jgi:hypothetical protein
MTDSLGAVMDDAKRIFEFRDDSRPQDRAHEYLTRNRVPRGFNDTAMLCAVDDMLRRAHAIGVADADSGAGEARETLYRLGGELIAAANGMGGPNGTRK